MLRIRKPCPTVDVLTVVTGIMLRNGADFQGVMDVLYPGIFTLGCAAMQKTAAEEIMRQHPKIREFVRVNGEATNRIDQLEDFIQLAEIHFGPDIEIVGPHDVSREHVEESFTALTGVICPQAAT